MVEFLQLLAEAQEGAVTARAFADGLPGSLDGLSPVLQASI